MVQNLRGHAAVYIGNDSLYQLAARQLTLANGLLLRGHAALQPVQLDVALLEHYRQRIEQAPPAVLDQARVTPSWSSLANQPLAGEREAAREQLTTVLETLLETD